MTLEESTETRQSETPGAPAPEMGTQRFLGAVLLPVAIAVLSYAVFVPVYQSNDDPVMEMLASGTGFCDSPSAELIFLNPLLGQLLSSLYECWPGFSWYWAFFTGAHVLASMVIAWVTLGGKFTRARLSLVAAYFLVFDLYFFVRPHWTIVAAITAVAAIFLWLDAIRRGAKLRGVSLCLFLLLAAVSSFIRYESAVLMFMTALPVGVMCSFMETNRLAPIYRRSAGALARFWRLGLPPLLAAAALVCAGLTYSHYFYASRSDWNEYFRFNPIRAQFTDYQLAAYQRLDPDILLRAGWSQNDYQMMRAWFFPDAAIYNERSFAAILGAFPRFGYQAWAPMMLELLREIMAAPTLKMMGLVVLLPFFLTGQSAASNVMRGLALASVALSCSAVLLVFWRLPPWLTQPLFAFAAGISLIDFGRSRSAPIAGRAQRWMQAGAYALLAVLFVDSGVQLWRDARITRDRSANLQSTLARLNPRPDQMYVAWALPVDCIYDVSALEAHRDLKLLGTGFLIHTPIYKSRLKQFGIQDLCAAIFQRNDVLVIGDSNYNRFYVAYVKEHYGKEIYSELIQGSTSNEALAQEEDDDAEMKKHPRFMVYRFHEGLSSD